MMLKEVSLTLEESLRISENHTITIEDIVVEDIEAAPFDEESYSAGVGVIVYIKSTLGSKSEVVELSILDLPYVSEPGRLVHSGKISIELVEVSADLKSVKLRYQNSK